MKLILYQARNNITIEQSKTQIYIYPFDVAVDKIPVAAFTVKGGLLVGLGASDYDELSPDVDQYVLTLDSGQPLGMKWAASGGGGGEVTLNNKSGGAVSAGDVVILDPDNDDAFTTTNVENDLRILGVAKEGISNNAEGKIVIGYARQLVNVTGNVARGAWLVQSGTSKLAKSAGYFKPPGSIGIALTEYTGGGTGTVYAIILPDHRQAIGGGFGWAFGGYTGAAATTNSQRLTMATETWATVATAALPEARAYPGGLAEGGTAAYCIGGSSTAASANVKTTAYKMPFATEVMAAQASADLATARMIIGSGGNGPTKGWLMGGLVSAGGASNATDIINYATSTRSAGNNLTSSRREQHGQSDGSYIYASGGLETTCDKVTVATGVIGAHADGNLGTAADGYQSLSFPAIAGYMSYKDGAASYSRKMPFSTGVSANTNALAQDQVRGAGNGNGLYVGFVSGDDASPYSQSSKLVPSTDTYSNNGASALASGKNGIAYANYGAY